MGTVILPPPLKDGASGVGLELLEEVIALVVDEDEGGEVFYLNLPDGLHTKFGVFHTFDALDVVLGKDGSRSSDGAEVEAAVVFASVGDVNTAVTLSEHDSASAVVLEFVNIGVHASCRGGAH